MYERLTEVVTCLDRLLDHQPEARLAQLRRGLQQALATAQADYTLLRQAGDWLRQLAALLDPEANPQRTGAQVRSEFEAYLAQIEQDSAPTPRLREFSAAIAKVSRSYAPGLFYTYDVPGCRAPTTTAKVSSAISTAACFAPPVKKASPDASCSAPERGNSCRIPVRSTTPLRRWRTSPRSTCARNNSVSVNIAAASDCIPVQPNRPRPNSLNSFSNG